MLTETKFDNKIAAIHKVRCNVKSLAAEARIIREETARCGVAYKGILADHRRGRLREEARYAQLVLAFFRGCPYRVVENRCKQAPSGSRLFEKAKRYLWDVREKDIRDWLAIQ